jgi:hemoglobin/transferrin/lactoferrin receptor protein
MKIFFLLWLLLGIYYYSYSQVITITDMQTGQPLEMATLSSDDPKVFAVTNSQGQADISAFRDAERIEIRMLGYKMMTKSYAELEELVFTIFLSQSLVTLEKVVISATRWNQVSDNIPARITGISAREVAIENPQTAADLLGVSGEVFIQKSQQGGGSPMIRGFSTNRLFYTVDGVRMNTAIFRSGNIQNVISLDPFAIENTEIFFGPGSVIYGSDAIGGVMSFQTLTPQLSLSDKPLISGKAVTRLSSANNENTEHFNINYGWKEWAYLISISYYDFDDLRMGSKGPDEYLRHYYVQRQDSVDVIVTNDDPQIQRPSGYYQTNIIQKLRFRPNEKWDFQYGFHYSETSDYSRYDRLIRYRNGLPRYGEWYYGPQKWMMNNLCIMHKADNKFYDQLTVRLAHQFFEESRISRDINSPDREKRVEEVNALSSNIDFNKSAGKKHTLYFGVEAVTNYVASTGTNEDISKGTSARGPARYPQSTWASYAAYVTDQFKLSEKLILRGGLRYNQYILDAEFDTTFYPFPYTNARMKNSALTGSLGFVYRPAEEWVISAGFSTGFRSPNVDDAGKVFDSEPGSVVIPNPDLKAEYAWNAELGIARVFGESVKIDLSVYYTILQDALVRRDFTLNGLDSIIYDGEMSKVQAIQNAASANAYGMQAGFNVKLPAGFGISSKFNYQTGEEELDDGTTSPSRHAPPWYGVSGLTCSAYKLIMQFYVIYSGEKSFENMPEEEKGKDYMYATDSDGNPYSPGWYTINFKAMYEFAENFSVSAGLENMSDKLYRPYSSGIAAPGRNFILSLKVNF